MSKPTTHIPRIKTKIQYPTPAVAPSLKALQDKFAPHTQTVVDSSSRTRTMRKKRISQTFFSLGAALTVISALATTYIIWTTTQNGSNARADLSITNPTNSTPAIGGGVPTRPQEQISSSSPSSATPNTPAQNTTTALTEELPEQTLNNGGLEISEAVSAQSIQTTSTAQSSQASNSQNSTQSAPASLTTQSLLTSSSSTVVQPDQTVRTGSSFDLGTVVFVLCIGCIGVFLMISTRKSLRISW